MTSADQGGCHVNPLYDDRGCARDWNVGRVYWGEGGVGWAGDTWAGKGGVWGEEKKCVLGIGGLLGRGEEVGGGPQHTPPEEAPTGLPGLHPCRSSVSKSSPGQPLYAHTITATPGR